MRKFSSACATLCIAAQYCVGGNKEHDLSCLAQRHCKMMGKRFNWSSVTFSMQTFHMFIYFPKITSLPSYFCPALISFPFSFKIFLHLSFLILLYYLAVVHLWISLPDCLAAAWCIVTFSNEPFLICEPCSWLPLVPACCYFISFILYFYVTGENNHSNNNAEYL